MFFMSEEEMKKYRMGQDALNHDVRDFMADLSLEKKKLLETLLVSILHSNEPKVTASYYLGIVEMQATYVDGRCICGEEHDKPSDAAEKMLREEAAKVERKSPTEGIHPYSGCKVDENGFIVDHEFTTYSGLGGCNTLVDRNGGDTCDNPSERHLYSRSTTPEPDTQPAQETREQVAAKYNVVFIDNTRVKCNGCGLEYVSLRDRMLKNPDDCHGCKLKAGHG